MDIYVYKKGTLRLVYISLWQKLFAEFSIPKLLYGSNVYMFFDIDTHLLKRSFKQAIKEALGLSLPDISTWDVNRIDFCYNFLLGSSTDVRNYINYIKLRKPEYFSAKEYDSSAFYWNKSHSVKFYNKALEMQARGEKIEYWMKKILRFEVTLRRRKIRELFFINGNNKTLADLLKSPVGKEILNKYLEKLCLNQKPMGKTDMIDRINSSGERPSTISKLLDYVNIVNNGGESAARELLGRNYLTRKKKLAELGLGSFFIPVSIKYFQLFVISIPGKVVKNISTSPYLLYASIYKSLSYFYQDGGG